MTDLPLSHDELLAFAAGDLSSEQAAAIEQIVRSSPEAGAMVTRYRAICAAHANDDGIEPGPTALARAKALSEQIAVHTKTGWLDALDRVVASLVFDSRSTPALAGVRGAGQAVQMSFECKAGDVDLELQPDGDDWRIMGQFESETDLTGTPVAVTTSGTANAVANTTLDEHGMFSLVVPTGRYDLHVALPDSVLVLPEIDAS